MIFQRPIFPSNESDLDFAVSREQSWYLLGVQLADKAYRMNPDFDRKLIDPFGTGTKAFWRGVLESAGAIRLDAAGGGDRKYPKVKLKGSHAFLTVFLEFLEEELSIPSLLANGKAKPKFDFDGKLAWQAMGGYLDFRPVQSRDIVRLLYIGETVGQESSRCMADRIVTWEPARRY